MKQKSIKDLLIENIPEFKKEKEEEIKTRKKLITKFSDEQLKDYLFWEKKAEKEANYISRDRLLYKTYLTNPFETLKDLSDKDLCDIYMKNKPSKEWVLENINYINRLNNDQRKIIKFYTKHGDKIINDYIRNNKLTNDILEYARKKEIDVSDIKNIVSSFIEIVKGAPKLKKDIFIYRGMTKHIKKDVKQINSFSLKIDTAEFFTSYLGETEVAEEGNIQMLLIPKGTPLLFMEPITEYKDEFEVILPIEYRILHDKYEKVEIFKHEHEYIQNIEGEEIDDPRMINLYICNKDCLVKSDTNKYYLSIYHLYNQGL